MRTQRKHPIWTVAALLLAVAACDAAGGAAGPPPQQIVIAFASNELALTPGERAQIVATVQGASGSALAWSSSDPTIATVDGSGTVTALAPGEAGITASYRGAQGSARVKVHPRSIARVAATPDAATLHFLGDSVRLAATAYDAAGAPLAGAGVTWTSLDTHVATVAADGKVTARGTGLARVVASANGKADSSMIQVVQVVAALAVSPATQTLPAGATATLQAAARDSGGSAVPGVGVVWASSNPAVATVDAGGTVRAVGPGSAAVTASAQGVGASARVDVPQVTVATLAISPASFALTAGQSAQASAVAKDAQGNVLTGRAVAWSSSNPAVANVSPLGVVFALAPGSATITATSEGKSATAPVTVQAVPVATLSISPSSFALNPGQTAPATAVAKDAAGNLLTGRAVAWSSSNPAVATVASGVVTAVGAGSATITATSEGKSATALVTVTALNTGGGTQPTILASSNFESGTVAPFTYPWAIQYPNDLQIVNDPTGSGRGKLASIHYVRDDPAISLDRNRGLQYEAPGGGIGLGQTIHFRGDVYLTPPKPGSEGVIRKLLYWQPDAAAVGKAPNYFFSVLTTFGDDLRWWGAYIPQSGPLVETMTPPLAKLLPGRWYRIEMQITLNSSLAANDGVVRIWLDGTQIYQNTSFRWSDPNWTIDPAKQKLRYFVVGQQVNALSSTQFYDEHRYWDNVTFSTYRLP